jgi:serine/threonine protein kinase
MRADDPLLQTLRGGDTATSLPPVVESLIARITRVPAAKSGDDTLSSPDSALLLAGASGKSEPPNFTAHLRPAQAPDELGRLGGYRVLRLLGAGGMGSVFLAEDVHLERHVALKVMRPDLAAKPEARQRFLREAKSTAKLKNDHVVAIYQVGEDNNLPFLAMEYLEGESLDSRLERDEPIPLTELLRIGREIAQGLAAAHAKGLVHRDIKPANLWLEAPHGRLKILDFGLARGGVEDAQITQSGTILGTPAFMAPEQAAGETADARSDLFSLGCVLYRLCTGKTPFEGPTVMSVLTALATQEPAPVLQLNRDIPEPLATLVMRLLAKRPENRPASAQAVLDQVRAIEWEPAKESPTRALPPKASPADVSRPTPAPEPLAKKQAEVQPRRPRRWPAVASATLGIVVLIVLGGVIIRITGKDGKVTELTVPDGSKIAITEKGEVDVKLPSTPEKVTSVIQSGTSPLDNLDPNAIPKEERFPWQPKELVAVIGKHERRSWWSFETAAFSPDGSLVATGDNREVVIWDFKT